MEITKTKLLMVLTCAALLGVAGGYGLHYAPYIHRDSSVSANVFVTFQQSVGTRQVNVGNVITDIGEDYARDILGFDNVTASNETQWISLSNDASPVQTWTELPNEVYLNGFIRALGTGAKWENGTDPAYNVTNMFTASGTQQLQCAGLQWSGTNNTDSNLFACAAFTQTTFESGDNLTITWVITWDGN